MSSTCSQCLPVVPEKGARKQLDLLSTMSAERIEAVIDKSDFDQVADYLDQDHRENGFRFVAENVSREFMTECEELTARAKLATEVEGENTQSRTIPAPLTTSLLKDNSDSNEISPTFIGDQPFSGKSDPPSPRDDKYCNTSDAMEDVEKRKVSDLEARSVGARRDVDSTHGKAERIQHISDAHGEGDAKGEVKSSDGQAEGEQHSSDTHGAGDPDREVESCDGKVECVQHSPDTHGDENAAEME